MNKKTLTLLVLAFSALTITGCGKNPSNSNENSGPANNAYDFIIYESDSDNSDLSDNKVVVSYHIEYTSDCKNVPDTLINKDGKYYFNETSPNYLVLVDSQYGLSYSEGYFQEYGECASGAIDVSWSYTAVNGVMAATGIGETSLDGLIEYGFVINGWK